MCSMSIVRVSTARTGATYERETATIEAAHRARNRGCTRVQIIGPDGYRFGLSEFQSYCTSTSDPH